MKETGSTDNFQDVFNVKKRKKDSGQGQIEVLNFRDSTVLG